MSVNDMDLFNIDLLLLNESNTKLFREVRTGAIFETGSKIFHKEGLFSTDIFGPLGSTLRNEKEAVINLSLPVMHPLVYETICSLNSKLEKIAKGEMYVKFNNSIGDFELSSIEEGYTGYTYLLSNLDNLKFKHTDSIERKYKIELCNKYCNTKSLITRWCVIPAGVRDYTEDKKGSPEEDEINTIYRKLISSVNMLKVTNISDSNLRMLDPIRLKVQSILVELYYYIKTLVDGKHKFIQGKFTKRATMYGTRNVLTPSPAKISDLTNESRLKANHSVVGIYQYVKAISPITMNLLHTKFLNKIFNPNSNLALLIDKDSMLSSLIEIPVKERDKWLSMDGLNDIMNKLAQPSIRDDYVKVDDNYLLLIKDTGNVIEVITDTRDIENDLDKNILRPITYAELFYITVEDVVSKYPCFNTRYPVAGLGGIYPSWVYLKTTTTGRKVELKYNGHSKIVYEYPKLGNKYVESISVDPTALKLLGADHDGDVISFTVLYTEESIKEIKDFLNDKKAYISADNKIIYSSSDDVSELIVSSLTE